MRKQLNGNFLFHFYLKIFFISFDKALLIDPNYDGYYFLGLTYISLGKKKEALERLILILFIISLVLRIAGN